MRAIFEEYREKQAKNTPAINRQLTHYSLIHLFKNRKKQYFSWQVYPVTTTADRGQLGNGNEVRYMGLCRIGVHENEENLLIIVEALKTFVVPNRFNSSVIITVWL